MPHHWSTLRLMNMICNLINSPCQLVAVNCYTYESRDVDKLSCFKSFVWVLLFIQTIFNCRQQPEVESH